MLTVLPLHQLLIRVNGYVTKISFVSGLIKLTPCLLIAIKRCSGNSG